MHNYAWTYSCYEIQQQKRKTFRRKIFEVIQAAMIFDFILPKQITI